MVLTGLLEQVKALQVNGCNPTRALAGLPPPGEQGYRTSSKAALSSPPAPFGSAQGSATEKERERAIHSLQIAPSIYRTLAAGKRHN